MKNFKGKNNPNWKGGKVEITCLNCGGKKMVPRVWIKSGAGKTCSKKCAKEYYRGKNSSNWQGGSKITIQCKFCGNEKIIDKSQLKHGYGKFCNQNCRAKYYSGERASNWDGGITPILKKIRHSMEMKKWTKAVLEKCGYTCTCGKIGGYLYAHHIKPFAILIKEAQTMLPLLPLYDAAMLYTPLWDVNNGEAKCRKCHKQEHRKINVRKLVKSLNGEL